MIRITTNSDKKLVEEIRAKIKENNGHCACAISFNDSNRCMCEEFRRRIDEGKDGECHCGLYRIITEQE